MGMHQLLFRGAQCSLLIGLALFNPPARAADFPSKPVKIILQAPAGSPPDVVGRLIADRLSEAWKQQVLIINRPGAGGLLAAQAAVAAEPDGYTLYQATTSSLLVLPVTQKLSFDLGRDMAAIGLMSEMPFFIAVSPSLGVNTLPELIALAKQRPGTIMYPGSRGGMPHLTTELFRSRSGIELTFVPHPNVSQAVQDVITGRIPLMIEGISALSGAIQSGSIKVLAVTSAKRLPNFPGVPVVAEFIPRFSVTAWFSLMAPAKTPPDILQRVNEDLGAALADPALQKKLAALGAFTRPMSPEQTVDFIRDQQATWWPIVKRTLATP